MIGLLTMGGCLLPEPFSEEEWQDIEAMRLPAQVELDRDASVALGRALYADAALSMPVEGRRAVSCQTCHQLCLDGGCAHEPDGASGADPVGDRDVPGRSAGAGEPSGRNTPTILYTAYRERWGWAGRFCTLEEQVAFPMTSKGAFNIPEEQLASRFAEVVRANHTTAYQQAFGSTQVGDEKVFLDAWGALTDFLLALPAPPAKLDRFIDGEVDLTDAELRGARLFVGKAECHTCHSGPMLSDHDVHAVLPEGADPGRGDRGEGFLADVARTCGEDASQDDTYRFQTPTLRAVTRTAPYMHDGSLKQLQDVLWLYDEGHTGDLSGPLGLTDREIEDLIAFLGTLEPE